MSVFLPARRLCSVARLTGVRSRPSPRPRPVRAPAVARSAGQRSGAGCLRRQLLRTFAPPATTPAAAAAPAAATTLAADLAATRLGVAKACAHRDRRVRRSAACWPQREELCAAAKTMRRGGAGRAPLGGRKAGWGAKQGQTHRLCGPRGHRRGRTLSPKRCLPRRGGWQEEKTAERKKKAFAKTLNAVEITVVLVFAQVWGYAKVWGLGRFGYV